MIELGFSVFEILSSYKLILVGIATSSNLVLDGNLTLNKVSGAY